MPKIFLLFNQQRVLIEDVSRECGFFLCLFNFFDLNLTYFPPYYQYYGSAKTWIQMCLQQQSFVTSKSNFSET